MEVEDIFFYGEFTDLLFDSAMTKICSGQRSELKEWIRTHPIYRTGFVREGENNKIVLVEEYMNQ